MSGPPPDAQARAWADFHARQAAAASVAAAHAGGSATGASRAAPPSAPGAPPPHASLGHPTAAADARARANQQAWAAYHAHQQQQAANAEAWRRYYAANPAAAAAAAAQHQRLGTPGAAGAPAHHHHHQHHPHHHHPPARGGGGGAHQWSHAAPSHGHPGAYAPGPYPGAPPPSAAALPRPPAAPAAPANHHPPSVLRANPPVAAVAGALLPPARAPPAAPPAGGGSQWPPPLKAYVERCFAACKLDESIREFVTDELKLVIAEATAGGALWTKDWDATPIPTRGGGAERHHAPRDRGEKRRRGETRKTRHAAGALGEYAGGYAGGYARGELSGDEDEDGSEPGAGTREKRKKGGTRGKKATNTTASDGGPSDASERTPRRAEPSRSSSDAAKRRRSDRFGDGAADGAGAGAALAKAARERRLASMRFALAESSAFGGGGTGAGSSLAREETWDALTIVGTCERLEKSYFRLTSAPDPATVRPRAVLEKALARLKRGDTRDGSDRSKPPSFAYRYATDQLKAIRQDLTVQRLRDGFAAEVYEHHARLALRNGDLGEFNQCQTVLAALYDELRAKEASKAAVAVAAGSSPGGGADPDPSSSDPDPSSFASDGFRPFAHETEFLAYRVLYAAATRTSGAESTSALARACRLRADPAVAHALAARAALESGDAVDWFRLRAAARRFTPLGRALMETRDDDVRFRHVSVLAKTVRPTVPVRHLAKILGFSDEEEEEDLLSRDDDRAGEEGEEKEDARRRDSAAPPGGGWSFSGRGDGAARRTPPEPSAGDVAACVAWLEARGAVLVREKRDGGEDGGDEREAAGGGGDGFFLAMDARASAPALFVPEDENAVAHGDQTLDIEDFLKKTAAEGE